MKCRIHTYNITKYISEHRDAIEDLLEQPGTHLMVSGTGSSKTYTVLSTDDGVFRLLSKKYPNRIFIIACPNRIQNQQNAKKYKVFALIGGEKVVINTNIITMVYEKSYEALIRFIKEQNREVTLIIDEAHQLIVADNYRGEGIESLEELSKHCFNTIHLTATSRLLEDYYVYDNKYFFEYEDAKANNNLGELYIHAVSNIDLSLILKVKQIKTEGKQVLVIINSNDSIGVYKELLEKHEFVVGVLSSECKKNNEVYDSVTSDEMIPPGYDVVLATSLVECGTNIENTNVVPIVVIKRADYFSRDSVEQTFARLRKKNKYGIMLINKYSNDEERSKIVDKDIIEGELRSKLESNCVMIDELIEFFRKQGFSDEHSLDLARQNLELTVAGLTLGQGVIEIIDSKAIINEKEFVKKVYANYDKQYIYNPKELPKYLEGHVKADKIILAGDMKNDDKDIEEDLKEIGIKNNETREGAKAFARCIILKHRELYLAEYINDKSVKDMFAPDAIEEFDALEEQKYELNIINRLVNKLKIDYDVALDLYAKYEKESDIDKEVEQIVYLNNNLAIPLGSISEISLKTEYVLMRKDLDSLCEKQSNLSYKKMIITIDNLIKHNKYEKVTWYNDYFYTIPRKHTELLKEYESEKDKKEKRKILKKIERLEAKKEKTLEKIKAHFISRASLIYNLSLADGQVRISSLKK